MTRFVTLLFIVLISGCSQRCDMELVPQGAVKVYRDMSGNEIIGVASESLQVTRLVYPDKTDYVVEVRYQGQIGYVRGGAFTLKRESECIS